MRQRLGVDRINSLPEDVREWIHDLASNADPAGTLAELRLLQDAFKAQELLITELKEKGQFGWIEIKSGCQMPKEQEDILYVVRGKDHSEPVVVRGMRCHDGEHWWWCDQDGNFDVLGNDGKNSYVSHWMPTPTASVSGRTKKKR